VTDSQPPSQPPSHPASHVAVAITLYAKASSLKIGWVRVSQVKPLNCFRRLEKISTIPIPGDL